VGVASLGAGIAVAVGLLSGSPSAPRHPAGSPQRVVLASEPPAHRSHTGAPVARRPLGQAHSMASKGGRPVAAGGQSAPHRGLAAQPPAGRQEPV